MYIQTGLIDGVQCVQACGSGHRGLIFAPPLIGGHGLQQIRMFRKLVHHGFDLISFNYAGHGDSTGAFCFQASIDNCLGVLDWASRRSQMTQRPLFGIASCFGALPLFHAVAQRGEPLKRMVLINAVPHWRWETLLMDFLNRWVHGGHGWLSMMGVKAAMQRYLDDLFPRVHHHYRSFGILSRKRMQWVKMLGELCVLRRKSPLPLCHTPVLCAYGRQDRLLQQMGFSDWAWYETHILDICPQTRFWPLDSDHFLSNPRLRHRLLKAAASYFGYTSESRPVLK